MKFPFDSDWLAPVLGALLLVFVFAIILRSVESTNESWVECVRLTQKPLECRAR